MPVVFEFCFGKGFSSYLFYFLAMYYSLFVYAHHKICQIVTGLFLSNENTIGPAIGLLALVLREASRDW